MEMNKGAIRLIVAGKLPPQGYGNKRTMTEVGRP